MKYTVTFAHCGYADIEANSEAEAYAKAEGYGKEDINWSDEFRAVDVQKN